MLTQIAGSRISGAAPGPAGAAVLGAARLHAEAVRLSADLAGDLRVEGPLGEAVATCGDGDGGGGGGVGVQEGVSRLTTVRMRRVSSERKAPPHCRTATADTAVNAAGNADAYL